MLQPISREMVTHTFAVIFIREGIEFGIAHFCVITTTHGRRVEYIYTTRRNCLTIWPTSRYTCRNYTRKPNVNYTSGGLSISLRRHMVRIRSVSIKCIDPSGQIHMREERAGETSRKRSASEVLEDESGDSSHSTKRLKRAFACPYYKNSPQSYTGCQKWHNYDISHVKDHIKRVHLRPHLCDRSGNISEAGTPNQNGSNSQDMNSGEERAFNLDLESAKTWQEIYMFLFPQRIPNKFWEV